MKVIAFNGSPRKNWNTHILLEKALEGAATKGAETEMINLYDLNYKGCISCFACKMKEGKSYGRCAIKDDLTPFLEKIETSDAIILGSPIYIKTITGEMKSFFERLIFQYLTYTSPPTSLFPKNISAAFIYTMGVTEDLSHEQGYDKHFADIERFLSLIFGHAESLFSFDAYQFEDYTKVFAPRFDVMKKTERKLKEFPVDCQKAFDLGIKLIAAKINNESTTL